YPRYLPPRKTMPLWHCSDPSCPGVHTVRISSLPERIDEALKTLEGINHRTEGPAAHWDLFFSRISQLRDHYDDVELFQLPWLLGNSFSLAELRTIVEFALNDSNRSFRNKFKDAGGDSKLFHGSPASVVNGMNEAACLQALLILSDQEI